MGLLWAKDEAFWKKVSFFIENEKASSARKIIQDIMDDILAKMQIYYDLYDLDNGTKYKVLFDSFFIKNGKEKLAMKKETNTENDRKRV